MADHTVAARARKQRDLRVTEGWQEVKVWVPTEEDADDVRKLAAERRSRAENLEGLSEKVPLVTPETQSSIAVAMAQHGSAAYNTPSGAILTLMTDLMDAEDLVAFSITVAVLARARPSSAPYVISAVPAKVSNFLVKYRDIDSRDLTAWTQANPDWTDQLKDTVRDPEQFPKAVEQMAAAIKSSCVAH
jgi:hypothetical protein